MKSTILLLTFIGPRQLNPSSVSFKYVNFFVLIPACNYGTSHNATNEDAHVKSLLKRLSGIVNLGNHFEQEPS